MTKNDPFLDTETLWTIETAASKVGVSWLTVRRAANSGDLKFHHKNPVAKRGMLFDPADVIAWVQRRAQGRKK
jgi:hypothetical protein